MHTTTRTALSLFSASLLGAGASAGDLTIRDFAPASSVFVAGVDDAAGYGEDLRRTGLIDLWNEPSVQRWIRSTSEAFLPQVTQGLAELGVDVNELEWPSGAVGLSAWLGEADPTAPPSVFIVADYGDSAESMAEIIVEAMERSADQGTLELDEDEVNDVPVWGYSFVPVDEGDDFGAGEFDGGELPMPELPTWDQFFFCRSGDYLMLGSSLDIMARGIDIAEGVEVDSIRESRAFADALAEIGDAPAYLAVLGEPGRSWLSSLMEIESPDEADQVNDILGVLGLGEIESFSMGVELDTDDGIAEQRFAVRVPKKEGLVALFDTPSRPFSPPAFVTADAATFSFFQFDFAGVVPLVQRVIAAMPAEDQQGAAMMQGMLAGLGPVFANIGPEVFISTSYERPFTPESQKQVWAISMANEQAVREALAGFFPMMGLQPREFMGNQIYAPAQGGMLPPDAFAMGLGFGHIFVGPTASVENAMRQAGAGAGAALADEPEFQRALSVAGDQGIGFSYTNLERTLEWTDWYLRNYDEILEAQFAQMFEGAEDDPFGGDEQFKEEMLEEMRGDMPAFMENMPPLDIIAKYLGDSVYEMRSGPSGFTGRAVYLRPE